MYFFHNSEIGYPNTLSHYLLCFYTFITDTVNIAAEMPTLLNLVVQRVKRQWTTLLMMLIYKLNNVNFLNKRVNHQLQNAV